MLSQVSAFPKTYYLGPVILPPAFIISSDLQFHLSSSSPKQPGPTSISPFTLDDWILVVDKVLKFIFHFIHKKI